jgi:uncharacterized membrane protein YgcG
MTKIKGIPMWEQYLEYIVLAVAVLVCIALVTLQFIGNPNAAKVGSETYAPSEVDRAVADAADEIDDLLTPQAASPIDIPDPEPMLDEFLALQSNSVSPTETYVAWHKPAVFGGEDLGTAIGPVRPYRMPVINAPYDLVAAQYFDALTTDVVQANDELVERFTDGHTDITWTTVAGRFDLAPILSAFREESEAFAAIPGTWHRDRVYVLDVVLERQEQTTGGWGTEEVIATLPGALTLRPELGNRADAGLRDRMLALLDDTGAQLQIAQPEFYPTINATWTPPSVSEADDGMEDGAEGADVDDEDVIINNRLRRQIEDLQKKLTSTLERQKQLGCDKMDLDAPPSASSGSGGGSRPSGGGSAPGSGGFAGGASGGTGGRADPTASNQVQVERDKAKCRALAKQEERYRREFERLTEELEKRTNEKIEIVDTVEAIDPMSEASMVIWAHDITVEPYAVYRYRIAVKVYNPFFARGPYLTKEQQDLASELSITSEVSEWSEPMSIRPAFEDFIVRARTADDSAGRVGGPTLGSATVEVYRFQHGRWWQETFNVEPGDRIGETRTVGEAGSGKEVEFGTDWFVLDILYDFQASSVDHERTVGAMVQLLNMVTGEVSTLRKPRLERLEDRRQDLGDQVELANSSSEMAALGSSSGR